MPVDDSLVGRTFGPTPPYSVTPERLADFAVATRTPYAAGEAAPLTFPIVAAFDAMAALMLDPGVGIELQNVIHGEQGFAYERPIVAGDTLTAELTVTSLRQIGGNDIIGCTTAVSGADGGLVCTAKATLIHRGGAR